MTRSNRPCTPDPDTPVVAIVGGGASGSLLAAQLLRRQHRSDLRIVLIERRGRFGPGVAYSTPWRFHRLNVRAEEMGAPPRDPRHFLRWASARGEGVVLGDFAPRGLYGSYLAELLDEADRSAIGGAALERVSDDVTAIAAGGPGMRRQISLQLASGETVCADRVVLALGNLAPAQPPGSDPELMAGGRYIADPWHPAMAEWISGDEQILLLGTGLTMVDVALTIESANPFARIHAVSRKGLLPQRHRSGPSLPARRFPSPDDRVLLDEAVRSVQSEISEAVAEGGDWRQVVDSMRPVTNQIWRRLSEPDQRRFVGGLARHWDIHRHRMAPEIAVGLGRLRRSGRLQTSSGSIESIRPHGSRVEVAIQRSSGASEKTLVDRVVNCTGPALDLAATGEPLLDSLFETGLGRPGPLHLGLDHDARGALYDRAGDASQMLFTIGPMRKGRLWETTAIPEIRTQAFELADQITSGLERDRIGRAGGSLALPA